MWRLGKGDDEGMKGSDDELNKTTMRRITRVHIPITTVSQTHRED